MSARRAEAAALIAKYNVPGPRYTSYPTVPCWERAPSEQEWLASLAGELRAGRSTGRGAAIYVHIPFCESLCAYCGCTTRATRNKAAGPAYVDTVLAELALYRAGLSECTPIPLRELHLGGGTPTFLAPGELARLVTEIFEATRLDEDAELSIEADPRVTTHAHLQVLAALGFTRLSLGVQDFDPDVQQAIRRVQSAEQVRVVTEEARALGFTSVNYDLIYGLPLQTTRSVARTLETVCELAPDRIAFYSYAHVPWTKRGQRRLREEDLPTGELKRALYEEGRTRLEAAGYREIGMDHFAREGDALWRASRDGHLHRSFMGYTARRVGPLIGLGASSIGDAWGAFAQNEKELGPYRERVTRGELPIFRGHLLDPEDLALRRHIANLMTCLHTEWDTREEALLAPVRARLAEPERDGLVQLGASSCTVTEAGRAFLRNVCMAFDARLLRLAPSTQLFSATV